MLIFAKKLLRYLLKVDSIELDKLTCLEHDILASLDSAYFSYELAAEIQNAAYYKCQTTQMLERNND